MVIGSFYNEEKTMTLHMIEDDSLGKLFVLEQYEFGSHFAKKRVKKTVIDMAKVLQNLDLDLVKAE